MVFSIKNFSHASIEENYFFLAVVSFFFFLFEIVLFSTMGFVTTYFRAHLVIGISLLGFLVGCVTVSQLSREYYDRALRYGTLSTLTAPFSALAGTYFGSSHIILSSSVLTLVFVPFGFLIGLLWTRLEPRRAYFWELIGGTIGLGVALFFLSMVREEGAIFLTLFLIPFFLLVFCRVSRAEKLAVGCFMLFGLCLFILHIFFDPFNFTAILPCRLDPNLSSRNQKVQCSIPSPRKVISSTGSIVERVDVVEHGEIYVTAFAGNPVDIMRSEPPLPFYTLDPRIPFGLIDKPKTLIIGASSEGVAKVVKAIGGEDVVAVDLNPAAIELAKDERVQSLAKNPYKDIRLKKVDGRMFLAGTEKQFDIITMMNTHRRGDVSSFGFPDFLHTREAFGLVWDRLSPRGFITVEERNTGFFEGAAIQSVIKTITSALGNKGIRSPAAHIVIYEWRAVSSGEAIQASINSNIQILVKKEPWSQAEIDRLKTWAADFANKTPAPHHSFVFYSWVHLPGGHQNFVAQTARSPFSVENERDILTDNRPFAIRFPDKSVSDLVLSMGFFTVILLFSVFFWISSSRDFAFRTRSLLPAIFFLSGLGYFTAEMILIQWFQHFIGSVIVSLCITLGGFLIGSAFGGLFVEDIRRKIRSTTLLFLLPGILVLASSRFIPFIISSEYFVANLFLLRIVIATFISAVIGLALGTVFTNAALRVRGRQAALPLLIGINGGGAAFAVPASFLLLPQVGFEAITVIVGGIYLAIGVLLKRIDEK